MIKDIIENTKIYYGISENLKKGFRWLESNDLTSIEDGRYEIDSKIYANVQTYNTKEDALYEAHRDYIDIQYMVSGIEKVGVTNYSNCSPEVKYDKEKDIEFLKNNEEDEYYVLKEGVYIVLFPQDAHKPSINYKKQTKVKKVVVKVGI